jgi:hypothetical protein
MLAKIATGEIEKKVPDQGKDVVTRAPGRLGREAAGCRIVRQGVERDRQKGRQSTMACVKLLLT